MPIVVGGAAVVAYAADSSLFYAPEPATEPPVIVHRLKPPSDIDPPRGAGVPAPQECFNDAETRERIAAHKLADPFEALQTGRQEGDALRAKLCLWAPDEFVYDVAVLTEDGRIVHVYMNAQNGRRVVP